MTSELETRGSPVLVADDALLLPGARLAPGKREGNVMRRTRRGTPTKITEDLIHTMRVLRYAGQSVADIAAALKVSVATVSRYTREEHDE